MEGFVICSQCGKQIVAGKKFCTECGSPIPVNSVTIPEVQEVNNTDDDATVSFNPAMVQQETSVVLEKPAEVPVVDTVAANVEAPVVEPVVPVVPVVEPAVPVVEPAVPVVEPAVPVVEPVAPVVEPVIPVVEPVAPTVESATPVAPVAVEAVAPVAPAMAAAPSPVAPEAPSVNMAGMSAAQQYEAAMGQKVTAVEPKKEAPKAKPADKKADIPAEYKPVNMWGYYGLSILLKLPVIGFICTFIFAFAPKNKNIKNYARSYFCEWIITAIVVILVLVLILFAGGAILTALGGIVGDESALDGAGEIIESIQNMFGI